VAVAGTLRAMELRMFIEGDADGTQLTSLGRWLADDPATAPLVIALEQTGEPVPGSGGAPVDVIGAAADDAAGIGSLVVAYLAWRESRPGRPRARIEHDGAFVLLTDITPDDVDAVVRRLLN
jgi:hypothetical protein